MRILRKTSTRNIIVKSTSDNNNMVKRCSSLPTHATTPKTSCKPKTTTRLETNGFDKTSTFRQCEAVCDVCDSTPDLQRQLPYCQAQLHRSNLSMSEYGSTYEKTKLMNRQSNCDGYHKEAAAQRNTYQAVPSLRYREECAQAQAQFDLKRKNCAASTEPLDLRKRLPELPNKPPLSSLQTEGEGYGAWCFSYYKDKYKHEENWRFKDPQKYRFSLPVIGTKNKGGGDTIVKPRRRFQYTSVIGKTVTKSVSFNTNTTGTYKMTETGLKIQIPNDHDSWRNYSPVDKAVNFCYYEPPLKVNDKAQRTGGVIKEVTRNTVNESPKKKRAETIAVTKKKKSKVEPPPLRPASPGYGSSARISTTSVFAPSLKSGISGRKTKGGYKFSFLSNDDEFRLEKFVVGEVPRRITEDVTKSTKMDINHKRKNTTKP